MSTFSSGQFVVVQHDKLVTRNELGGWDMNRVGTYYLREIVKEYHPATPKSSAMYEVARVRAPNKFNEWPEVGNRELVEGRRLAALEDFLRIGQLVMWEEVWKQGNWPKGWHNFLPHTLRHTSQVLDTMKFGYFTVRQKTKFGFVTSRVHASQILQF
jgi:hypothetical protein